MSNHHNQYGDHHYDQDWNSHGSHQGWNQSNSGQQNTMPQHDVKTNNQWKMVPKQGWMIKYWRPFMAWQWGIVSLFDFLIAPILWGILSYHVGGSASEITQWNPITLQGAGFYHLAMGGAVGVYTWQRSREKIQGIRHDGY